MNLGVYADIEDLDPDEFLELINRDMRDLAPAHLAKQLRSVPDDWYDGLCTIKRKLELQIVHRKADLAHKQVECLSLGEEGRETYLRSRAAHATWRSGVLNVLRNVEGALNEARRLVA